MRPIAPRPALLTVLCLTLLMASIPFALQAFEVPCDPSADHVWKRITPVISTEICPDPLQSFAYEGEVTCSGSCTCSTCYCSGDYACCLKACSNCWSFLDDANLCGF